MINLLPPREKAILLKEEKFKLVLILETLFLVFLFFLILILFPIKIYVSEKVQSQRTLLEREIEVQKVEEFRQKINLINEKILKLDNFYQQKIDLTQILERVSTKLLSEMYLTSISYQKESLRVSLSGFSPTREILTEFKQNLEGEFKDVYFPPEGWVKPRDIEFIAHFKINDYPQ